MPEQIPDAKRLGDPEWKAPAEGVMHGVTPNDTFPEGRPICWTERADVAAINRGTCSLAGVSYGLAQCAGCGCMALGLAVVASIQEDDGRKGRLAVIAANPAKVAEIAAYASVLVMARGLGQGERRETLEDIAPIGIDCGFPLAKSRLLNPNGPIGGNAHERLFLRVVDALTAEL